ncbi:hypothetical protein ACFLZ0_01305 [Patescibacteria group bacterium]
MSNKILKTKICILVSVIIFLFLSGGAIARTYTLDSDFDEGILVGVEHDTVHDQLQLSKENVTLPFIWVPNSNEGTVSKYNTETGKEIARYRTGPTSSGNPSRTTVDQNGNVWFGNRNTGTVVKIGLYEAGQWEDRNGNTTCETSRDLNDDGVITGAEILPWWEDECVIFEVFVGGGPRGIAIDANGDLWVGTYTLSRNKFFHIDGETGVIKDTIDIYPYRSYGAVVDGNGYLWSSCLSNYVLRIDTVAKIIQKVDLTITSYGLGIDNNDNLFVAGWGQGKIAKIDVSTATILNYGAQGDAYTRGLCVTEDGDVWAVNSLVTQISRISNDLTTIKATIDLGTSGYSTGAAVDADGKVWACNYTDGYLHRIDPASDSIDLSVLTIGMNGTGVGQHYSYSDMTGIISRNITTKIGSWNVIHDSGELDMPWGFVSWTSNEPDETAVTVKARSSNDLITWSAWEDVANGMLLNATPDGQYIEIEAKLQTQTDDSPILYDLTVESKNLPPDCSGAYPSIDCLWSPNHKEVIIDILGIYDPDGDVITIEVTSITSDESTTEISSGGEKHSPDAWGIGTDTAIVRSERAGLYDGRVYVINFIVTDGNGGECQGSVSVKVPHDQSDPDCLAIDSGQIYDATTVN